ncbi:MAG: methyltransferase domain-containing protein [Candidatus Pacebacteria bacterium]|nr:methyltransferase domain-containing protein [Candidatus Paceibacterota bacterium]
MFSNPSEILRQCGISAGSTVGDFGVGEGTYTREAAHLVGPQGIVYAFDIQKNLIARLLRDVAREKSSVIHPLWVDLEVPKGTKLSDGALDLAIVANILFQVEEKDTFIREVFRVLRQGGRALIVDWKESFGNTGPHADHVVNEATAREHFVKAGFVFDKSVEAGAHHYGLIFRKPL